MGLSQNGTGSVLWNYQDLEELGNRYVHSSRVGLRIVISITCCSSNAQ
jgi:hypothetical protein